MKDNVKKIRAAAKSQVAEVLSQGDETAQKQKMEELVENYESTQISLTEAKAAVEDENKSLTADNEALRQEKKELEEKVASLEKELSDLKVSLETSEKAKVSLENQIAEMEKDVAVQKRVVELEEAGLLTSEAITDKVRSRIKKMDEEEFADWKAELISFRADWEKKSTSTAADKPEDSDAAADDGSDDSDDDGSAKMTAAALLKLRKQIASLQAASSGKTASDGGTDLPEDVRKEYASMWDDEKEEK